GVVDAVERTLSGGASPPGAVRAALCAPAYLAPERRDDGSPGGPRDDMFAVGVLLHEMLTGRPPAGGAEGLDEVRALPPWLAALARRCLAEEPAARWPDAAAALEVVTRSAGGGGAGGVGGPAHRYGAITASADRSSWA